MVVSGHIEGLPTIADLLDARAVVARHHPRTPLYGSAALSRRAGCQVFVKYENHSPIRSFKARGALYGLWRLPPAEREKGVVTASTGNHGQGIAYAGRIFGIPTTIVVPHGTPDIKCEAIQTLGGELLFSGRDVAESAEHASALAVEKQETYLLDGDDGALMAGAATLAWEILEDLPDVSRIVVPVGGGNLIAATSVVARLLNPKIRVVGVQSAAAPAVTKSWEARRIITTACDTFAEGIATSYPVELAFRVIKDSVDTMLLVSEDELRQAVLTVLETTGQIAEGARAAPFAALKKFGSGWRGEKVVLILSGGNLPLETLRALLQSSPKQPRPRSEIEM